MRFGDFLMGEMAAEWVEGFEFLNGVWCGEVVGFSHFLRAAGSPEVVESINLDLGAEPTDVSDSILRALGVPWRRGAAVGELVSALGARVVRQKKLKSREIVFLHVTEGDFYEVIVAAKGEMPVSVTVNSFDSLGGFSAG
jgi:hypothetical protein